MRYAVFINDDQIRREGGDPTFEDILEEVTTLLSERFIEVEYMDGVRDGE